MVNLNFIDLVFILVIYFKNEFYLSLFNIFLI